MQEHPSADQVLAEISDAFPEHAINSARAFIDWGTTYLDADGFEAGSRGRRWKELEPKFLEFYHDAMWFLGPATFAEYLPAFLVATLVPTADIDTLPVSLLNVLTRKHDDAHMQKRFDARLQSLTGGQHVTVARALEYLEMTLDDGLEKRLAKAALDSYWRELLHRRK